jgi:hypothetical protein
VVNAEFYVLRGPFKMGSFFMSLNPSDTLRRLRPERKSFSSHMSLL